jgi:DNA modification methylase
MTTPTTFLDGKVTLYQGDVRAMLALIPDDSVDCVVTSPPYWGLRDYGVEGQLGLEPTLGEHLAAMVEVFREVRRVLKPEGTCWINYGDCYATSPNGRSAADTKAAGNDDRTFRDKPFSTIGGVLKAKDLCMVPQRLAIALQEDGWWMRSFMPWIKRNGMPESISDRPANSLEYVMLLTKSARYWYDAEAVRRPASASTHARVAQNVEAQAGSDRANGGAKTNGPMKAVVRKPGVTPKSAAEDTNIKAKGSWHASTTEVLHDRNFRNTDLFFDSLHAPYGLISDGLTPIAFDVPPMSFSDAHFATFPTALVDPMVRAGCPKGGVVLDIFGGAGTTGLVAARLGRKAILIELNPEYADIAQKRIERDWMGEEERRAARTPQESIDALPLFGTA